MDNLQKWNFYLKDIESPQLFVDWSFYYMIGAALERRVWWGTPPYAIYPNVYVVFIAPPGVGKSLAGIAAKEIFKSFDEEDGDGKLKKIINRGPDSLTLERLIENLHDNYKTLAVTNTDGTSYQYTHSSIAFFASGELGTLLRSNTYDLVRLLVQGWDCGDFDKETRTQKNHYVRNLCISLFGCGTPDWMRSAVDMNLFNEGLSSRTIFLYADKQDQRVKTFAYEISEAQQAVCKEIADHVYALTKICGKIDVPKDVQQWCDDWYQNKNVVLNEDRKLGDYYGRKKVHLMKMIMIVHFANSLDATITIDDCEKALAVLNHAEVTMSYALSGMGINPIAKLASSIELYIKANQSVEYGKLVIKFYDQTMNGENDVKKAVDFLTSQGRVGMTMVKPFKVFWKQSGGSGSSDSKPIEISLI